MDATAGTIVETIVASSGERAMAAGRGQETDAYISQEGYRLLEDALGSDMAPMNPRTRQGLCSDGRALCKDHLKRPSGHAYTSDQDVTTASVSALQEEGPLSSRGFQKIKTQYFCYSRTPPSLTAHPPKREKSTEQATESEPTKRRTDMKRGH